MGEVNVEEMLRKITAKQFLAWEAYLSLVPTGDDRLDWLFAGLREMIHNVAVEGRYRRPIGDFILDFKPAEELKQRWEDQLWIAQMWVDSSDVEYHD